MVNSKCTLTNSTFEGIDSLVLSNGRIEICVVPELGGKISSIIDLSTGREWLWRNPYLPIIPVEYGASFIEKYDTGGIDECFPAISASAYPAPPWKSVSIPDHGELWCQPWEIVIVESSESQIILRMTCDGVGLPYRFERTLTFSNESPVITLDYRVENLSEYDMPFVWSIHPLMNIEEGMQITLPEGLDNISIESATNEFFEEEKVVDNWPTTQNRENQTIDLSIVPSRDYGQAYKLFVSPTLDEKKIQTSLIDPSGKHSFTFKFSPQVITHIALWMNYSGWSGIDSESYFNLGFEPCIGGKDSLPSAIEAGEFGTLSAKEIKLWQLEILIK